MKNIRQTDLNNQSKALIKDTLLFAVSNFGSKILVFILTPLYTSILSTQEYGIADLINTVINFAYPVLTLAIAESTLRFAMDHNKNPEDVLYTSLLFEIISIVLLIIISPLIMRGKSTFSEYWYVFVFTYAVFNMHNCFSNYAKAIGKTRLYAVQGILQTVSVIVSNIVLLVVFKLGVYGYLFSIIVGYVVPSVLICVECNIVKGIKSFHIQGKLLAEMLNYSVPMIPTLLAWSANTSIDKFMIIGFIGLGASGIYSVAHKIPSILTTILSIFTQAWQLSAIENYGKEGQSDINSKIFVCFNFVNICCCLMITLIAKPLSRILFSNDYFTAWTCVPLLTASAVFSANSGFLAANFRAAKKTKDLFVSVLIGAIVNVILNLLFIPWLGVVGASLATSTGFFTTMSVRFVKVQKIVQIKLNTTKTSIMMLLMVLSIMFTTLDYRFAPAFTSFSILVIIVIHVKEVQSIFSLFSAVFKTLTHRIGL